MLTGLFQSIWTKRCSGNRRSTEASGETVADRYQIVDLVGQGGFGTVYKARHLGLEIDVALKAHELVKVRVFNDNREERSALLERIVAALDCAPVQSIGKLFVLWRPRPPEEQPEAARKSPAEAASPKTRERVRDARRAPAGVPRAAPRRRRRAVH